MNEAETRVWNALENLPRPSLAELFAGDGDTAQSEARAISELLHRVAQDVSSTLDS